MLTIYQFIIIAAGLFGVFQFSRISSTFFKVILIAQLVAIILTLPILGPLLYMVGFFIFYSASLAVVIHSLTGKGKSSTYKAALPTIAIPGFLVALFKVQHWPYVSYLMLLCIVPLIVYLIIVLTKRKKYRDELGTLTIITADALIHVLMFVNP